MLNKADLVDLKNKDKVVDKLKKEGYYPCFFTVLKDSSDKETKKILPNLIKQIDTQLRFNRELVSKTLKFNSEIVQNIL